MSADHTGRRVKALAEERGVTPEAMAVALETSVSTVYRWYAREEWPGRKLRDAARALDVPVPELRGDAPAASPAPDATEPVAPGEADGLEVGGERELWERIGYYRGKQELALENSETSSRLAREASEMLDRAIRALREVHEHTVPMPRSIAREITPAQQAALARAAAAKKAKREQDELDARRRGGQAG